MKLAVCTKSETPLYLQLYNQFVSQILCGALHAHDCLPSIRFVARELEISVIPVKSAYELLEQEGYIYTLPAKGCFVAELHAWEKQCTLALAKVRESVQYCQSLGLSKEQFHHIAEQCFDKNS